jgi:hypothetical protein
VLQKEESSFFEKKKQKDFSSMAPGEHGASGKSFLVLFFKKERLAY